MPLAETRTVEVAALRVEPPADGAPGPPSIVGYAAVFDTPSVVLRDERRGIEFVEKFRPGAFAKALAAKADVRALVNHEHGLVLGRTTAGTLRLAEDDRGLRAEIDPPDTQAARDIAASIRRGDVSGMSLRFYYLSDVWDTTGAMAVREVIETDIDEVSICTFPAYPDTEVALRSLESHRRGQPRRTTRRDRAVRRLRLAEVELSARRPHLPPLRRLLP